MNEAPRSRALIGRRTEAEDLLAWYDADESHFVVVYGRRRVGKTFLVRETLGEHFAFAVTGLARAGRAEQLDNFADALAEFGGPAARTPATWLEAFRLLRDYLRGLDRHGKKVVFLDEAPWMDTSRSGFLTALEWFWNGWASTRSDILLVVCGSATAWIAKNLLDNTGGLYNRVTRRVWLQPFTLGECEAFAHSRGLVMSRTELIEAYMAFGGIPYYLDLIDPRRSLQQNIGRLCFAKGGQLRNEFFNLYQTLFRRSAGHVAVVRALAAKKTGLTHDEIARAAKMSDGGGVTRVLRDLELSGFVESYAPFGRKRRGTLYQLVDFYSIFYLTFIEGSSANPNHWAEFAGTAAHAAWTGHAFERVCQAHVDQIKTALGISGVGAQVASWRSEVVEPGAQIDLVINRADHVVNLCEMKFAREEYAITKAVADNLRHKRAAFVAETGTKRAVHITLVTPFGLIRNSHSGIAQSQVTADDLFRGA
ncbi:MAG: ATP-binding protein [Propionibacteriaceae bacterium]|jgi:hypothetical protein|nr:ATP-binding protein [Propionibacteriaceae bacterium]